MNRSHPETGKRLGYCFALVGILVALAFTGAIGVLQVYAAEFPFVVASAGFCVFWAGGRSGAWAASRVARGANPYLSGLLSAYATVAIPTLLGTLPFALRYLPGWERALEVLLIPLFLVSLYGGPVIVLLGLLFGQRLGRALRQTEHHTAPPSDESFFG